MRTPISTRLARTSVRGVRHGVVRLGVHFLLLRSFFFFMPKAATTSAELTEDELLDQAIADKRDSKAAADAGVRPLTRTELIAKLDQVMLLHVVATENGNKQIVPGSDGELCWFSDVLDAKAELGAMQASMGPPPPGMSLGLDFCPLGRAFSLSDGWVSPSRIQGESPPMRLQPSSNVLEACGAERLLALEGQLPPVLKKRNRRQGAFPLFSLKQLQNERVMPYFFAREELVTAWVSSGRPVSNPSPHPHPHPHPHPNQGDFRWEHFEQQLPPGVTLTRGRRGFTDKPNFLVARAKKVRGS